MIKSVWLLRRDFGSVRAAFSNSRAAMDFVEERVNGDSGDQPWGMTYDGDLAFGPWTLTLVDLDPTP